MIFQKIRRYMLQAPPPLNHAEWNPHETAKAIFYQSCGSILVATVNFGVATAAKSALMQGFGVGLFGTSSIGIASFMGMHFILEKDEDSSALKTLANTVVSLVSVVGAQWLGFEFGQSGKCS